MVASLAACPQEVRGRGLACSLTMLSRWRMEKGFWIVSFPLTRNRPGVNMWMPSFLNRLTNDMFLDTSREGRGGEGRRDGGT